MTAPRRRPLLDDEAEDVAARLFTAFQQTGDARFRAAAALLRPPSADLAPAPSPGRPPIDDDPALAVMAVFVRDGMSERAAATSVIAHLGLTGHSRAAIAGRLRRKFRLRRADNEPGFDPSGPPSKGV
jgi:hypothetical protein